MTSRKHQVCTIALDHEVAVDVAIDHDGRSLKISADFRAEQWKPALDLAVLVRSVVAEVNGDDEANMQISQQYVSTRDKSMRPQVCIESVIPLNANAKKVGLLAKTAVEFLTGQMQMSWAPAQEDVQLSAAELDRIRAAATEFLEVHRGTAPKNALAISCEGEIVASVAGPYKSKRVAEVRTAKRRLVAMFDGRRLRRRILFVAEITKQAKEYEISYDEAQFDETLKALAEDKMVELDLEVEEVEKGEGKKTYRLISLARLNSDPLSAMSFPRH